MDQTLIDAYQLIEKMNVLKYNEIFTSVGKFYMTTNENIKRLNLFSNIKNKNLLTVCGSGDQALNAVLNGAKSVTLIDINRIALYHFELKCAAIKAFDYNTFVKFYKMNLPYKMYLLINKYLRKEINVFFTKLYEFSNYSDLKPYIMEKPFRKMFFKDYNDYASEFSYNKLKELISSFNFNLINSNATLIDDNNKYDVVYLSNVFDYIHMDNDTNSVDDNLKNIIMANERLLLDNGKIIFYLFESQMNNLGSLYFKNNSEFGNGILDSQYIGDYKVNEDYILTYTKKLHF